MSPHTHQQPLAATTESSEASSYRVLIVDDNPAIHDDFRKILQPHLAPDTRADDLEAELFGTPVKATPQVHFELDSAFQGEDALRMVNDAIAEGRPYAMAFVDVRMPPGWDGVETVNQLWEIAPGLQMVICTAYSDYTWEKMRSLLRQPDSLVVLKKPFDNVEVQQLAHTLCRKWELNLQAVVGIQQLEKNIQRLLAPAAGLAGSPVAKHDPDLEAGMMISSDGLHFVTSLMRLSGAVESTRRQLRLSEQQLVQGEKMASLGRLSAGILHEINNPLNYSLAALSLLESEVKRFPDQFQTDHKEAVADMRDGFSRMTEITGNLRKFAYPENPARVWVSVGNAISTALSLMAAEIGRDIVVDNRITNNVAVWAAGAMLEQVFIHLIHNSTHALRAKVYPAGAAPRLCFDAAFENGRTTISVIDNGVGIPSSELGKIFDPFYTTREIGKGAGLGLGICHQILKQSDATIEVESEEGVYTRFKLTFSDPVD